MHNWKLKLKRIWLFYINAYIWYTESLIIKKIATIVKRKEYAQTDMDED